MFYIFKYVLYNRKMNLIIYVIKTCTVEFFLCSYFIFHTCCPFLYNSIIFLFHLIFQSSSQVFSFPLSLWKVLSPGLKTQHHVLLHCHTSHCCNFTCFLFLFVALESSRLSFIRMDIVFFSYSIPQIHHDVFYRESIQ